MALNHGYRIRILTLIFHFFIVIGFGHGVATLGIIEVLWFPYFNQKGFTPSFNAPFQDRLPFIGLLTLLGQIGVIASMLITSKTTESITLRTGITLQWLALISLCIDLASAHNRSFVWPTAIPFAVTTFILLFGRRFTAWYQRWSGNPGTE